MGVRFMIANKVNVVIPSYNRKDIIGRAIDSVLAQTYKDIEIIVVDDGSTDGTAEYIHETYPNIKIFTQENNGAASARNLGISKADGEYIAFLDTDDYWLPEKIAKQVSSITNDSDTGMNVVEHDIIEKDGSVNKSHIKKTTLFDGGDLVYNIYKHSCLATPCVMVKRLVLDDVGVFDTQFEVGEDDNLWMRIAARYNVSFVNEALTIIDCRSDGLSRGEESSRKLLIATIKNIEIIKKDYPIIEDKIKMLFNWKLSAALFSHAYYLCCNKEYFSSFKSYVKCFFTKPSFKVFTRVGYTFLLSLYNIFVIK